MVAEQLLSAPAHHCDCRLPLMKTYVRVIRTVSIWSVPPISANSVMDKFPIATVLKSTNSGGSPARRELSLQ